LVNLPWDHYTPQGVEFYGQLSCLNAGIAFADVITTVSPRYSREITTPEFGCGLDGLLRYRQNALFGILNGVDYEEWSTISDPNIAQSYSATDLGGKAVNKERLQKELGLPVDATMPLFGSIGRLVEHKGVAIVRGGLSVMLSTTLQFCLIGRGFPA